MSLYLQIAIGCIPALFVMLIYLAIKRHNLLAGFLCSILLIGCAGYSTFLYVTDVPEEKKTVSNIAKANFEDIAALSYALMSEGDIDQAENLLDDSLEQFAYTGDYVLAKARLEAYKGNYKKSAALYGKVSVGSADVIEAVKSEQDAVNAIVEINALGLDTSSEEYIAKCDAAVDNLNIKLKEGTTLSLGNKAQNYLDYAGIIAKADKLYDKFMREGVASVSMTIEADGIISDMDDIVKKNKSLAAISQYSEARVKMQLLTGDYDAIAGEVTENTDYASLMVASELYRNGYVSEKDFNKDYAIDASDKINVVIEQIKFNQSEAGDTLDKDEKKQYKAVVESLQENVKRSALVAMKDDLNGYAKEVNNGDESKIYMQLAKLEYDYGTEGKASEYITSAITTGSVSKDAEYANAIQVINDAITNKNTASSLMNVPDAVIQAIDNMYVYEVPQQITIASNKEDGSGEDGEIVNPSESKLAFEKYVTAEASKKRSAVNIMSVDASKFDTVTLNVAIDGDIAYTPETLKKILSIKDCGEEITEGITIQKISNDKVNTLLLCDNSGSMDEDERIGNLKKAVRMFVEGATSKENISIVTFTSGICDVYEFGTDKDTLLAAVDRMEAWGGTAMYSSSVYCANNYFNEFTNDLNIIILLSDGEDNYYASEEEVYDELVPLCKKNNIVIYALGLGSGADENYMEMIASATKGKYFTVIDPESLSSFYTFISSQIQNQYVITYKAKDTLSADRTVEIALSEEGLIFDSATYSIGTAQAPSGDPEQEVEIASYFDGVTVTGLDTRTLYQSAQTQTVNLYGQGFKSTDYIKVKLDGSSDYFLDVKYVDENTYSLTIPANIVVGNYNLDVTIGSQRMTLQDGLIVYNMDDQKNYSFGRYNFTAMNIKYEENGIILSGDVILNDWLHFNGNVTLRYVDGSSNEMILEDYNGSYVLYDRLKAEGLARFYAGSGRSVSFPAWNEITIYDDKLHGGENDDYKVTRVAWDAYTMTGFMKINRASASLYPGMVKIDFEGFSTALPGQDQVIKLANGGDSLFGFSLDHEEVLKIKANTIDAKIEVEFEEDNDNSFVSASLGQLPIKIGNHDLALSIDTDAGEYSITYKMAIKGLDKVSKSVVTGPDADKDNCLGATLIWNENLKFDGVEIYIPVSYTAMVGEVPVTFDQFSVKLEDLAGTTKWWEKTATGKGTASVGKLEALADKLGTVVSGLISGMDLDDVSLASVDGTLTFSLGDKYIGFSAEAKLLEIIDVGKVEIELGNMKYTNVLLGMEDVSVSGFRGAATVGPSVDLDVITLKLQGTTELAVLDQFIGVTSIGEAELGLNWWIFEESASYNGGVVVGFLTQRGGNVIFLVRAADITDTDINDRIYVYYDGSFNVETLELF